MFAILTLTAGMNQALSVTLDMEISPLGLRSICIEPGYFRTELLSPDNRPADVSSIPDYKALSNQINRSFDGTRPHCLEPQRISAELPIYPPYSRPPEAAR
jgi:NAD(P)-dependent dehydrogenase (short-subunit alcohol dehydrogenase family)